MKPLTAENWAISSHTNDVYVLYPAQGKCSNCEGEVLGTHKYCRHCGKSLVTPKTIVLTTHDFEDFLCDRYRKYGLKCGKIIMHEYGPYQCQARLNCARCEKPYTGGGFCTNCGAEIIPFGKGDDEKFEKVTMNSAFLHSVYKWKHPSPLEKKYTCLIEVYTKEMEDCNPNIPIVQFASERGMTPEQILNSSFDSDVWKHVVHGVFNGVDRMDWADKYPTAILTPPHLEELFDEGFADFAPLFDNEEQFSETLNRVNEMDEDNLDWIYHRQFDIECDHCGISGEFHAYLYLKPVKED